MLLICLISMILAFIFIFITLWMSMKYNNLKNKLTPFECGFNPMNSSRIPFSLQFFIIAILFLIFDIEIILLLPIPISIFKNLLFSLSTSMILLILMIGLFFEWKMGSLNWL